MTGVRLSPQLQLPDDYATKRGAIVARSGGGKTYTAAVLAEEMTAAGQPWYALDPTDAWWGLKSSANGKRAGLPIIVIGGEHADVPIDASAGAAIAELVAGEPSFYVIVTDDLPTRAAEISFATAFFQRLYRIKRLNRSPLHGFWDEADLFAPQDKGKDETKLLHHAEAIVRRGRRRGLGTTMITQRPQILHKNVLSQIDVLVALKLGDPRDRKAIDEWLQGTPDPDRRREVLDSLAGLALGEAWVYGPGEDPPLYARAQVRERRTFNSSASGDHGDAPVRLADVDLDAVRERLATVIEKAEADDPSELRRQIRELKSQLASREPERVEVPVVTDDAREALEQAARLIENAKREMIDAIADASQRLNGIVAQVTDTPAAGATPTSSGAHHDPRQTPPGVAARGRQPTVTHPKPHGPVAIGKPIHAAAVAPEPPRRRNRRPEAAALASHARVSGPQQRVLDAHAWLHAVDFKQPSKTQVGFVAGYRVGKKVGGNFGNVLGQLHSAGLIVYPAQGCSALTDAGRELASQPEIAPTTEGLQAEVFARLASPEQRVLQVIVDAYPDALAKRDVGEAAGYSVGEKIGGNFGNILGRLHSLGLVEYPALPLCAWLSVRGAVLVPRFPEPPRISRRDATSVLELDSRL